VNVEWAARIARGLRAVWIRQVGYIEGGTVDRVDGLLLTLTNLPDQTLNVVLVEDEPKDPKAALLEAERRCLRKGHRLGMDLESGRNPPLEDAALGVGLRPVASRPGMAVPVQDLGRSSLPAGLAIRRVEDRSTLAAFVGIQVEVFDLSPSVARRFIPEAVLETPGVSLYLALLEDQPVGTAVAHVDDGAVGIFGVATLPRARGRGVGSALTVHAALAAPGVDLAWLQATSQGRPVYERLGFARANDWLVWLRPSG
jgi:GNAT superfamily N-acetyltransferase